MCWSRESNKEQQALNKKFLPYSQKENTTSRKVSCSNISHLNVRNMALPLRRRLYKKAVVTRSSIPVILQCTRYGHVRISCSDTKVKVNFLGSGSRMNVLPSPLVRRLYNPPPPPHPSWSNLSTVHPPTYIFVLCLLQHFPFLPPLIKPQ